MKIPFFITVSFGIFLLSGANAGANAGIAARAAPVAVPASSPALPSPVSISMADAPALDAKHVHAGEKSPLRIVLAVQKIYRKNGKEHREEAGVAAPGDLLEYRAEYRNTGKTALENVVLTLPLPDRSSFVSGSAQPAAVMASTSDKRTIFRTLATIDAALQTDAPAIPSVSAMALMPLAPALSATAPKEIKIAVLQWSIEKMSPNQVVTVSARVRVDGASPPPVSTPPAGS